MKIYRFFVGLIFFILPFNGFGQINVTNSNNANTLAQKLVGDGVSVFNATIQCEQNQSGVFTTIASNLGQDSGIVLTTGLAATSFPSYGVNGSEANFANFNQGNLGDAALTALAGTNTYDRCILEFDFKANGDSIFFKYVFGSEEYPAYNCTAYNDVFAFFITGPGYPTPTNIALVPGTSIPVAINSINNGVIYPGGALSNCTAMGPGSPFTSLYVNNTGGSSVTYSGFTQLLTAKAAIQPCSTYHLKLAIADGFDHILDSGVFLKAGSLNSNTFKLKVSSDSMATSIPYVYEGCDSAVIKIKRKLYQTNVNADTVTLVVSGTATSGVDYPALQSTYYFTNSVNDTEKVAYLIPINDLINEGVESVILKIYDQCNIAIDSIQIDIKDPPKFTLYNNDTTICLGKSVSINGIQDNGLSFQWSPSTGVSNTTILNPIITPTVTTSFVLTSTYGSCAPFKDTITVTVNPLPTLALVSSNILCFGQNTGSILASGTASPNPISFNLNPPGLNISGSPAAFGNLGAGTYTVTATSGFGCTNTASTTLIQPNSIQWQSVIGSNIACNGGNIGTIAASANGGAGSLSYTINPGNISNASGSFSSLAGGTYTITVTDGNGCTLTSLVQITQTLGLTWGSVVPSTILCNGQSNGAIASTITGGVGTITYSLQPGNLVNTSGNFSNLGVNNYTINAIDANGCTAITVVAITQPSPLTLTVPGITNVLCNGANTGAFNAVAIGGSGGNQFTLAPGNITNTTGVYSGLAVGIYTLSVSNSNGCTSSVIIQITQPAPLVISNLNTVLPTCIPGNNGSISFQGSGGTPAYQYRLNNGAFQANGNYTALGSGVYTITVRDANNCTATSIINLVSAGIPVLTNASPTLLCNTTVGNIVVTATNGVAPYTYNLQPNNISNSTGTFPNINPGNYTVTVTGANGCSSSIVIQLLPPQNLNWSSFVRTNVPCNGIGTGSLTASVTGGTTPYTYQVNPGAITNTSGAFPALNQGTYTITATDVNGCTTTSVFNINVIQPVSFTTVVINNILCNGQNNGSVLTNTTGAWPTTFTLNPGAQTNIVGNFYNLAPGTYTLTATDVMNCPGSTIFTIAQPPALLITNVTSTMPSCVPGADGSVTVTALGGATPLSYSLNNGPLQGSSLFQNLSISVYTIKVTDANGCTATSIYNLFNPNAPSFSSLTSNQIACAGVASGTVTAVVSGGIGTINYTINPLGLSNATGVFLNLPVNIYTVTASDANGCAVTSTIAINQPSQLVWNSFVPSNVLCNGLANGQLTCNVSGGVSIYTYVLTPGAISNSTGVFSNLNINNYTVTATDANGCSITSSFNITQPPLLAWNTVSTTNACNNNLGSINVSLLGGSPTYNYTLNPGAIINSNGAFTLLSAANYTITGTDANGCTLSSIVQILQSPLITMTSLTNTIPSCNPGNNAVITALASGGTSPLAFSLNGGAAQSSGIFSGIGVSLYTIQVSDANGCTISSTINVSNPSSPSISSVNATSIPCFGQANATLTAIASGGNGGITYSLLPIALNNTTGVFNAIGANNYTVQVVDANNCSATSNFILNQPPLLIWDSVDNRDVSCFGGSNGLVTSSASGGTGLITYTLTPPGISNISGAFFGLSIGSYTLTATDSNGCVVSSVFLINQAPPIVWNSVVATAPTCFGLSNATINVNAVGGNGGFEYQINPGGTISTSGQFLNLSAGSYTITAKDVKSCTLSTVVNIVSPAPVSLGNVTTTFASCSPGCDGTAVLSGIGGNNIYSYSVNGAAFQSSNSYNSLCASNYTVVVMDGNNCTGSGIFTITTANGPTALNLSTTPITCNGLANGIVTSSVTGGVGTLNYLLQPGGISNTNGTFNSLAVNTYTITVTDVNGCTISNSVAVTQPFPLILSGTNVTNVSCYAGSNGSVSTSAVGGNGAYNYTLNPSAISNTTGVFTTLSSSVYTINVVDALGCTNSISVTITQPSQILPNPAVIVNVSCNGGNDGSIQQAFAGGTGGLSYTLMPGTITNTTGFFNGLPSGGYTVTATDILGCTASVFVNISEPSILSFTAVTSTNPSCIPGGDGIIVASVNGGTPAYSYSVNGGASQLSGTFNNVGNAGTYTIQVADALGCTATSLVVVQAPPIPSILSISSTMATCAPGCDGTLTVNAIGGSIPYNYSANGSPMQISNVLLALCANNYLVTVTDALGCTVTSNTLISTTPSPILNNVTTTNALCNNSPTGSITLGVSGGTNPITYVLNPGSISNTTGVFVSLVSGTYTISGTDVNGCTLSTITSVAQPNSLVFTVSTTIPPSCNGGANGSLTVYTSGGSGSNIYGIQPNLGTFAPPSTFNGLQGNITYTITATDLNGCTATTAVTVSQPPPVIVNSMSTTPVICNGAANGTLQVNGAGGVGTIMYNLNPGALSNATGSFSGLVGNTYTATVTDANGCTATSSIVLFEPSAVTVSTATSTNIICYGQVNGTVNVNGIGGTLPLAYSLQPTNQNNTSGAFAGLGSAIYTVTITDANGCTQTTSLIVIEPNAVSIPSIQSTDILCHGQSNGTITAQGIGGVGTISYLVMPGNTTNTTGVFSGLPINTYTIQVSDANGCTISSTVILNQPNQLISNLDSVVHITCHGGNNGSVAASASGGTFPYSWNLQPQNFNSSVGYYTGLSAGAYSLFVTDQNGCVDSVMNIILIEPTSIQFDLVTHQDIDCYLDSSGSITVSASGGTGNISFSISPNLGIQTTPGQFDSLSGGNYVVIATDALGCTQTTSVLIKQNLQIVASQVDLIQPICHGDSNGVINIVAQGGVAPISYSLNGGQFSFSGYFPNQASGTHTITIMDAKGCSYDTLLVLTEPDLISATIAIDGMFCADVSDAKLRVKAFGGRGNYTYYLKPGLYINKSGVFNDVGPGTYTLTITDSAQCSFDSIITVSLPANALTTKISKGNLGCYGNGTEGWAQVNVSGGQAPYSFLWNTTPMQTNDRIEDLRYGWYKVEVTDANGCIKKDSIYIEPGPCCEEVFIPNAFSPNGDGKNDVWRVVTATGIDLKQLEIYDRWGNRVWVARTFTDSWDGNYKGSKEDTNTFYYLFRYKCLHDGMDYMKKGDIILLR